MKRMNMRNKDMKTFSKELNDVFDILNKLTGTDVVSTDVVENGNGDNLLHIKICGRDSFWDKKLSCVDVGMWNGNPFIGVLKSLVSNPTEPHPMLWKLENKETTFSKT